MLFRSITCRAGNSPSIALAGVATGAQQRALHRHGLCCAIEPVAGWWLAEELLVIGCGSLYIYSPWAVAPGEAQCKALFGYLDPSLFGTLFAAIAALLLKIHL